MRRRLAAVQADSRVGYGLPAVPPRTPGGIQCHLRSNECRIGEDQRGYCGLRTVRNGRFLPLAGTPERGLVEWYRDLKAWTEDLHRALTGLSNRRTLENFARAAQRMNERAELPLVVASTLLVPGYVDADEVGQIARFIASFDARIPYALLAFAPAFQMTDLPTTSLRQAQAAEEATRAAGLVNVRVGNRHLLRKA